jgi:thioredoxin-like negative regulator of GroEL
VLLGARSNRVDPVVVPTQGGDAVIRRTRTVVRVVAVSWTVSASLISGAASAAEPVAKPAVPSSASTAPLTTTRAAEIDWLRDVQQAHERSLRTNKPMLIVFGVGWCEFCRKLDERTLSDEQVAGVVESQFVPVLLDYDRDRDLARKLEVKALPCTVVLSPDADLLGRLVGYVEADRYREALLASHRLQTRVQQVRYQLGE